MTTKRGAEESQREGGKGPSWHPRSAFKVQGGYAGGSKRRKDKKGGE